MKQKKINIYKIQIPSSYGIRGMVTRSKCGVTSSKVATFACFLHVQIPKYLYIHMEQTKGYKTLISHSLGFEKPDYASWDIAIDSILNQCPHRPCIGSSLTCLFITSLSLSAFV